MEVAARGGNFLDLLAPPALDTPFRPSFAAAAAAAVHPHHPEPRGDALLRGAPLLLQRGPHHAARRTRRIRIRRRRRRTGAHATPRKKGEPTGGWGAGRPQGDKKCH